jgi:hypothetical protein
MVASKNEIYNETGMQVLETVPAVFYRFEVRGSDVSRFEKLIVQ